MDKANLTCIIKYNTLYKLITVFQFILLLMMHMHALWKGHPNSEENVILYHCESAFKVPWLPSKVDQPTDLADSSCKVVVECINSKVKVDVEEKKINNLHL